MAPETWTDQRTPALAIVARGDQITDLGADEYRVASQSNPGTRYLVTLCSGEWTCSCEHHQTARRDCIHVLAVKFRNSLRNHEPVAPERPTCERCHATSVARNGCRANESGVVTRWKCMACGSGSRTGTASGSAGVSRAPSHSP